MKRRRSLVIALLLVASLALGIGYAAFTVNMEIGGNISVGAPAPAVTFEDVSAQVIQGGITSGNEYGKGALHGQSIDLNVGGFRNAGDQVVVTYTVKNAHDFPVSVNTPVVKYTNTDANYNANISIVAGEFSDLDSNGYISANGGTATFTVTITLDKSFASDASISQNFRVEFTATGVPVRPSDNT